MEQHDNKTAVENVQVTIEPDMDLADHKSTNNSGENYVVGSLIWCFINNNCVITFLMKSKQTYLCNL